MLMVFLVQSAAGQAQDWFNLDPDKDGILGAGIHRFYEEYGSEKCEEVVVAVIDSGVDTAHADLKGSLWVNPGEIPENGLDDDRNGYVDDINGWNFLGGEDGRNVITETYGEVRHFRALRDSLRNKDTLNLSPRELEMFNEMKMLEKSIAAKARSSKDQLEELAGIDQVLQQIRLLLKPYFGSEPLTKERLEAIDPPNEDIESAKTVMMYWLDNGLDEKNFESYKQHLKAQSAFHYNIDYDPRGIVGDDPNNPYERYYGNSDVNGGYAEHGTHVAGIIAANRKNGFGISGVGSCVKVMILRAVPNGDERDKDVANAILYAVENGAKVINMSFGKGHSPHREAVEAAVRKAEEHDVLIVHSAGNAGVNIDEAVHYPSRVFEDGSTAENWIEVGASDKIPDEHLLADFTNYGAKGVDLFAPGVDIYSLSPENGYAENSGTSMAAPVVSGIAAALWSYFPELKASEVKKILMKSGSYYGKLKVNVPNGSGEKAQKTKFKKLCRSGRIVNLYNAAKTAQSELDF